MLALNAGMRDAEIKNLTWGQIDLVKRYLAVGRSKTEAGEVRTIPLNSVLYEAVIGYVQWYTERFGGIRPEWYVFPFGKPRPSDPTRPVTTLKTAWRNLRINANVKGRWHDNRHTLVTELAERGAGDQTIMDIAGHVSKQMLKHYSHIHMEAKRAALESIVDRPEKQEFEVQDEQAVRADAQQVEGQSLQKSLQSAEIGGRKCGQKVAKRLKMFGSPSRTQKRNAEWRKTPERSLQLTAKPFATNCGGELPGRNGPQKHCFQEPLGGS